MFISSCTRLALGLTPGLHTTSVWACSTLSLLRNNGTIGPPAVVLLYSPAVGRHFTHFRLLQLIRYLLLSQSYTIYVSVVSFSVRVWVSFPPIKNFMPSLGTGIVVITVCVLSHPVVFSGLHSVLYCWIYFFIIKLYCDSPVVLTITLTLKLWTVASGSC